MMPSRRSDLPQFLDRMIDCVQSFPMPASDYLFDRRENTYAHRDSLINPAINLSANSWVIALIVKNSPYTHHPNHAFLVLEGKNILNDAIFYRMELTQPDPTTSDSEIKINSPPYNVILSLREKKFQEEILGNTRYTPDSAWVANTHYYHKHISIGYETAMKILDIVHEEQSHPPPYQIRGNRASSVREGHHNCFTWAREVLKHGLHENDYQLLGLEGSWFDRILVHPRQYLLRNNNNRALCQQCCAIL